jgi:hypothetical protein
MCGVHANQLWPERKAALLRSIELLGDQPALAIEVGTWFALGSTEVIAAMLPCGSKMICVDSYEIPTETTTRSAARMSYLCDYARAHASQKIIRLEDKRPDVQIHLQINKSVGTLRTFEDEIVDFIYLDGSHSYSELMNEIAISLRILRLGGILCGDDLDALPSDDLVHECQPHRNKDLLQLKDGRFVHPGVICAIADALPNVEYDAGHWRFIKESRLAPRSDAE